MLRLPTAAVDLHRPENPGHLAGRPDHLRGMPGTRSHRRKRRRGQTVPRSALRRPPLDLNGGTTMADRKASVALELQAAQFKAEAASAAKSVDVLDRDVEKLDRDLNKIPADAAKAAAALAAMGAEAKRAGTTVDDLGKKTESAGKKTQTSADDAGKLRTRIDELQGSVKKLAAEFDRTGDPSLLKKFRADSNELAGLKRMAKGLEDMAVDVEHVGKVAEKAGTSVSSLFQGGLTSPVGIGAIAAAAPVTLAAAGGLAGVAAGGGVAAAGVGGAIAGNPQAFQAEWGTAINHVKKAWIDASVPFTGPTIAAIRSIGPMVDSWHIDTMFSKAATFVEPLVHGTEGFISGVERGVAALVDKAGPEIAVLSADLPKLGDAIGRAMSMISSQSAGGAEGLHAVVVATESLIVGFGAAVTGAEAFASGVTNASNVAKNFFDSVPGWVQIALPPLALYKAAFDAFTPDTLKAAEGGTAFGHVIDGVAVSSGTAAQQIASLQQQIAAAGNTMDTFVGGQVVAALNTMMSLDQATLGFNGSLLQLSSSFKQNGLAIDKHTGQIAMNTEKGIANRQAILSSVQANIQSYQANIAAGMSAEQAASAYDANTHALEANLKKAGLTQSAIDGLIGKYRGVPKNVDTDIVLHGLETAIRNLDATLRLINGIHDKNATVSVTTVYHTQGSPPVGQGGTRLYKPGYAMALGGIRRAAEGLVVPPSDPGSVLFGEPQTGGEALIPLRGISQTRAMGLAQTVGNNYGFSVTPWAGGRMGGASGVAVSVTVAAPPGSDSAIGTLVNKLIRDGLIVVKASQVRAS